MNCKMLAISAAMLMFILIAVPTARAGSLTIAVLGSGGNPIVLATGDGTISVNNYLYDGWTITTSAAWLTPVSGPYRLFLDFTTTNLGTDTEHSAPNPITLMVSATGFHPEANSWDASVDGSFAGSLIARGYFDNSNSPFAETNKIFETDPLSGSTGWNNQYNQWSASLYSVTISATINHPAGTQQTSFNIELVGMYDSTIPYGTVPEPSLLLCLSLGLIGVEVLRRKL
jgi:hypothetical protein